MEIFQNWFIHHPSSRPLLLLLDGHSTHYNPGVIRTAAQEKVIIFCLPPNTTHLTQPLDKGAFGPLKTCWNQECQKYMRKNPHKVITQFQFMSIFSQAWYRAMTIPNIMSAFHTTGVYPLNRHAVEVNESLPRAFDPAALSQRTGLAFIPLYSPARAKRPKFLPRATPAEESPFARPKIPPHRKPPPEENLSARPKVPPHVKPPEERQFTVEEHARFTRRFEEGYDITTDEQYNQWLDKYHPSIQSESASRVSSPVLSVFDLTDTSLDHSSISASSSPEPASNLLLGVPQPGPVLKKFLQLAAPQNRSLVLWRKHLPKFLRARDAVKPWKREAEA